MVVLTYADDVVLISESHNSLKLLFCRLVEVAKKAGLQINEEKTEYMVMGRSDNVNTFPSLQVSRYKFRRAKNLNT